MTSVSSFQSESRCPYARYVGESLDRVREVGVDGLTVIETQPEIVD